MSERVLIVDDDASLLSGLARHLGKRVHLATAESPEAALEMVEREGPFAVVLSDLEMPGMNGIQLLSEVQRLAPDTVRMIFTAFADLENVLSAVNEVSLFRFLTKPCPPPVLERALAEGIQQYRRILAEHELHGLRRQKELLDNLLHGFIRMLETRDPYTVGHQRRVAQLARAIAGHLGLDADTVEQVRLAALIHDIGKIYVPSEFLNKPGRLSDLEMGVIRAHPQVGYEVLLPLRVQSALGEIVRQHHERMDGSGYPQGLPGRDILFEARIIAVADVVEAMASHRPYRPALGLELALKEIKTRSGAVYDPDVVRGCLELFEATRFAFGEG